MATGSRKTYNAVSFINRLIKFSKAKRVLFLVDKNNLGEQTLREFDSYPIPGWAVVYKSIQRTAPEIKQLGSCLQSMHHYDSTPVFNAQRRKRTRSGI